MQALWIRRCSLLFFLHLSLITMLIMTGGMATAQTNKKHFVRTSIVSIDPLVQYIGQAKQRTFECQKPDAPVRCYKPQQILNAYSIQPLHDRGITGDDRTIVIINAFDAPSIREDLRLFNEIFDLPDTTLRISYPDGRIPFDKGNPIHLGWASESALDVEWAHVVAPEADIHLVLARSNEDVDMLRALEYAVERNLGDVISMSFGQNENCLAPEIRDDWHAAFAKATRKNITLIAASGDTGAAEMTCTGYGFELSLSQPAVDPLVTAVGGTTLDADVQTGAYNGEIAWNDPSSSVASGGGFSTYVRKPMYQNRIPTITTMRGLPDVAYNAAFRGGILVISSDGPQGPEALYMTGGTSAGAPQWAGIVALANQMADQRLGFLNMALYTIGLSENYSTAFRDITTGNNTVTFPGPRGKGITVEGYEAETGWDPVTGWGTPIVDLLVPLLIETVRQHAPYDLSAM